MSGFPVSMGTGLALETILEPVQSLYDEAREVDKLNDTSDYSIYAFNVSTILRNLISNFKFNELIGLPKKDFLDTLIEEVDFIRSHFEAMGLGCKFYIHTYNYVKSTYPTKLRKPNTEAQHTVDMINSYCLNHLKKDDDIHVFDKDVRFGKEERCLIMTHVPFDLLSYSKFSNLDLLESHTGKIKSRKNWNTKYLPVPDCDMSVLPFMEYLLSTFGDHVMFKPDPINKRQDLYKAMVKKGVNPLTSELSLSFMRS